MMLYIHGFNSSPLSSKAQQLREWLVAQGREAEWVAPALPHDPTQAIALLSRMIETAPTPPKLIGSSLGGFYATYLVSRYQLKAVLLNPAVHPSLLLRPLVGKMQTNWHDASTYLFTTTHLDALSALEQFTPTFPENLLVLLETGDEVLDWQVAAHYYRQAHQAVFQGGDHSFSRFQDLLELVDRF